MRNLRRWPWLVGALAVVAGCGSVAVPSEQFYRLELAAPSPPDPQRGGVLRVHDLQLGTALDSDSLLQQEGLRLSPRPWSRWVAPLDRLVTDALVLGLSRARVCDLVKSGADPGSENWSLRGRIVEFVEARTANGHDACVVLELWLEDGNRLLFHDEFTARQAIDGPGAEAAVAALSRGLQQVVDGLVGRMRERDLFAAARAAGDRSTVAAPAR
jgi:uncharacterized lipoprotein YmbA